MLRDPPRKPLDATLSRTNVSVERRGNRLVPAPCRACGRDELPALLRTDYLVYFRCDYCAGVECRQARRSVRDVAGDDILGTLVER